jgi:hypothetical protein
MSAHSVAAANGRSRNSSFWAQGSLPLIAVLLPLWILKSGEDPYSGPCVRGKLVMRLGLNRDGSLEHFERLVLAAVGLQKRRELLVDLEQVARRKPAQ